MADEQQEWKLSGARQTATALLQGADPAQVLIDSAAYGDWAPVLQRLAEAYAVGGTAAVVRSFDVLAQLDRNIAALVAGSPTDESFDAAEVAIPALPAEAHVDVARAAEASPWLDTYIEHSRRWSPRSFDDFHESIGLWILSTIAARRVVVHLGKAQYTPLCIALAGRSSLHAKTTAAEIGLEVLHLAGLDWFLADDNSTPQKFILDRTQRVPEDYDDLSGDEQQAVRRRLAFAGQCGWWYDEFGMLLHAMARSGSAMSDFSSLLRKFDDCAPHYSYGTISRKTDRIINPYVALLASLTPADLRPLMRRGSSGWSNGFWARWAFVTPPNDRYRTDRFPVGERTPPPALIWTLRA